MSGRSRFSCAPRRTEDEPTTAPSGNSSMVFATGLRNASRTSSRGRIAAMAISAGRIVSTSFSEWTAKSISPVSNQA